MPNELFQIAGDDPSRGRMSGVNFTDAAAAKPVVLWRDRLLTLDVYKLPNEPLYIILYCPICMGGEKNNNSLRITEDNKEIDFDPKAMPVIPGFSHDELVASLGLQNKSQIAGRISIRGFGENPGFGCAWESEPDLRRKWNAVCPWNVVIDNNIARDVSRRR